MAKQNIEDENKVVNFEEAAATTKKRTSRKKAAVVEEPKTVAEEKTADIEKEMNQPEELTMRDIAKYCDENSPETNDIIAYFNEHNIINKDYISYNTLVAASRFVIDNTCFDEDGRYSQDTFSETVYESVMQFYLFTRIEFDEMTYEEVFDYLRKYHLLEIINMLHPQQIGELRKYCMSYINDIKTNEYSTESLLLDLIHIGGELIKVTNEVLSKPEIANVINSTQG